jgi:hypothetical protein
MTISGSRFGLIVGFVGFAIIVCSAFQAADLTTLAITDSIRSVRLVQDSREVQELISLL